MRIRQHKADRYGFSMDSPVHVAGFYEECVYIENLRDAKRGKSLSIRRIGSNYCQNTKHPIDVYEVVSGGLTGRTDRIYIDLYGKSDWRAPDGYTLLCDRPAREGDEPERELGDELQEIIRRLTK